MKRVWVVDDDIPIQDLYAGPYPHRLDKELVKHLVEARPSAWAEPQLRELCGNLCGTEFESSFFRSPESVVRALDEGAVPPHTVIFDWEYGASNPARNVVVLDRLLESSLTYVQIYTHVGHEGVEPHVTDLRVKYPNRLLPTRMKADVSAPQLAEYIRAAWSETIAGELADQVRSQVSFAVERALIDFCEIGRDAIAAITRKAPETFVDIILSRIRDEIGSRAATTLDEIVAGVLAPGSSTELRRLMSVWYYYFPADQMVRRGDLIEVDGELGFVVTPPCHLARFSGKTGRRLTWLRLAPFDQGGLVGLRKAGLKIKDVGHSVTAALSGEALMLLPNVPLKADSRREIGDFALISHAWQSRDFEGSGSGEVAYTHLEGIVRRCTLADPFASAIVARATAVMASQGTPDFPPGEIARLKQLVDAKPIDPAAPSSPPAGATT